MGTNVCISFGYMVSAASPSINVALIIGGATFMPLSILGGFLIPVERIPVYLAWIKYLSFYYYTNELYNINEWSDRNEIECDNQVGNISSSLCFDNGYDVMSFYGIKPENYARDFGLMCTLFVGYR